MKNEIVIIVMQSNTNISKEYIYKCNENIMNRQ